MQAQRSVSQHKHALSVNVNNTKVPCTRDKLIFIFDRADKILTIMFYVLFAVEKQKKVAVVQPEKQ